jgi:hypothetical protein
MWLVFFFSSMHEQSLYSFIWLLSLVLGWE